MGRSRLGQIVVWVVSLVVLLALPAAASGAHHRSTGRAPHARQATGHRLGRRPAVDEPETTSARLLGTCPTTDITSDITASVEWTQACEPFIIDAPLVTVTSGATVTIDPGVVVKFISGAELAVSGAVQAVGTASLPVIFTSIKDDASDGKDSGGDGTTAPQPGDWTSMVFSGSTASNLDFVDVRYGGAGSNELNPMVEANVGGAQIVDP